MFLQNKIFKEMYPQYQNLFKISYYKLNYTYITTLTSQLSAEKQNIWKNSWNTYLHKLREEKEIYISS